MEKEELKHYMLVFYTLKYLPLKIGDISNSFSFKTIRYPSKSSGFDLFSSKLENAGTKALGLSWGIFIKTTEKIFSFGNKIGFAKSESFVTNTRFFDLERDANFPFETPFGAITTSNLSELRNLSTLLLTFSSNRNLSFEGDSDIIFTSGDIGSKAQSSFDMLLGQRREILNNLLSRKAAFQHFQYLPDHNPGAFESRLAMTNIAVNYNVTINFKSHIIYNDKDVFKDIENQKILSKAS